MAPPVLLDTCALYMMNQNGWLPDDYVFDHEEANAADAVAEFDALLHQTTPRLKGAPYVFDRVDAYEPEPPSHSPPPSKSSIPL